MERIVVKDLKQEVRTFREKLAQGHRVKKRIAQIQEGARKLVRPGVRGLETGGLLPVHVCRRLPRASGPARLTLSHATLAGIADQDLRGRGPPSQGGDRRPGWRGIQPIL